MKKIIIPTFVLIFIFLGTTVWYQNNYVLSKEAGDISKYKTKIVASEKFSEKDINEAIDTIADYFKDNFKGCILKELYYAGDKYTEKFVSSEDAIVLLSTFYVKKKGGDGSLNQDYTYENWNWILIKNNNGKWEHIDHGY